MIGATIDTEKLPEDSIRTAVDASFRRGTKSPAGVIKRWMHFAHKTGRFSGTPNRPCHDPDRVDHSVAVGVFKLWLEKEYKNCEDLKVIPEKRLIIQQGDPPVTRRPDLAVYRNDFLERVLEIKRSPISIDEIVERTIHLSALSPKVEWHFARNVYRSSQGELAREWLTEQGISYFYYWYDSKTHKIEFKEGRPVERRQESLKQRKGIKSDCVHFLARDELTSGAPMQEQSFTVSELGAAVFQRESNHSAHAILSSSFQAGDIVYWGTSMGKWLIESIESDLAHIRLLQHAGYNTRLTKPLSELRRRLHPQ